MCTDFLFFSPNCCTKIFILQSNTWKRPNIYYLFYILTHIQFNSASFNFVASNYSMLLFQTRFQPFILSIALLQVGNV